MNNNLSPVNGFDSLKLSPESLKKYDLTDDDLADGSVDIPAATLGKGFVYDFLHTGFPLTDYTIDKKIFAPHLNRMATIGEIIHQLKNDLDMQLLISYESIQNNVLTIGAEDIKVFARLNLYKPLLDKPNSIMVDVGAHIGYYTLFFKDFLRSKKIYSFEMDEYACNCIKNLHKNNDSIIVENLAVSDKDETVKYYKGHSSQMYSIFDSEESDVVKECKTVKLDNYFGEEKIDFIKIDVEGAEIKVLKGMERISKNIRFLFLETHRDKDWPELVDLLEKYNMECMDIHTGKPINSKEDKKTHHCFCKNKKYPGNDFELSMFLKNKHRDMIIFDEHTIKYKNAVENLNVTSLDEVIRSKGYERI